MSLPPKRSRPTAHDLERYAGLFASRTKVMTSSAMRDLMALAERPEVITLAGGFPDTSTFPPESYAKIQARVAAEATAKALQYGPTEGQEAVKRCIVEVMEAEGMTVDPCCGTRQVPHQPENPSGIAPYQPVQHLTALPSQSGQPWMTTAYGSDR